MILTSKDEFRNSLLQEVFAQSNEEFLHDHSGKQLDGLSTLKPDVVVETEVGKSWNLRHFLITNLNQQTPIHHRKNRLQLHSQN